MDSKLLVHLAEVVDCGSISKATIKLNITQPTLTRNMKLLEEFAGAPILRRTRHGVSPTDLGVSLAKHGREIRAIINNAHDTLNHHTNIELRELTIGTGPMLSFAGLTTFFHHFPPEKHATPIRFVTNSLSEISQNLKDGAVDIAILLADKQLRTLHDDIVTEHLFNDEHSVFAGATSPLLNHDGPISSKTLRDQTWAMFGSTMNPSASSREAIEAFDLPTPRFAFMGDSSTPLELMKSSDVLMVLPNRLGSYLFRNDKTGPLTIEQRFPGKGIVMCATGRNLDNPHVIELWGKLKQHFQIITDATNSMAVNKKKSRLVI